MFNYLVENKTTIRDLPVPLDEFTEDNHDRLLFTLVDGDTVLSLSRVFNEQDARRLQLIGREVISLQEGQQLDFYSQHNNNTTRGAYYGTYINKERSNSLLLG